MLTAYVGIATPNGLEVFVPEHDHVVRFLARRVRREGMRRATCYWAVLPDEAVREVTKLLEIGESYAALLTLDRCAAELGPILPRSPAEGEDAGTKPG